jgi:fatty acid-binding protein DegV
MAQLVKKEFDNLHIIESTSAAYANEVVLKKVVELVEEKKPLSTIIKTANALYDNTFSIFSVEETSGMRSGGRVTNAILKVIDFMSVQPIIRLNTSNEYAGIAKNYFKAIPKMIKAAKD